MGNLTDHFAGGGGGGNVLEHLQFYADGRTVTTAQGDITAPNVTAIQKISSTSFTEITNCSFDYLPPSGTTNVLVEASFAVYHNKDYTTYRRPLPTLYARYDGTIVPNTKYGNYMHGGGSHLYMQAYPVIKLSMEITGTDDIAGGEVSSWDVAKTISFVGASYNSDQHAYYLHLSRYGNTSAGNTSNDTTMDQPPFFKVTALK